MQGTTVSPAMFRERFPLLENTVHLASCSLGPRSAALDGAMDRMLAAMGEGVLPWESWLGEVEESRLRFARLIGAPPEDVAVVPSASVGAFQVASTMDWADRPRIVTTEVDYPSVVHIWLAQRPRGAEVACVADADGVIRLEDYAAAIDERTALVSIPLVSYRNGARMPVAEVTQRAREVGARVFVDAYQAAGVLPIDVNQLGCDYLVSGTMKYLLGLSGIGYLYARGGVFDDIAPQLTGWYGRVDPLSFDPHCLDFPPEARRFQIGIPSFPSALAANAGLALIEELDVDVVSQHVYRLVDRTIDRLRDAGCPIASPTAAHVRGPQVALAADDPRSLAAWLADRRIFAARGHVVRLSFHYFNNEADVDAACAAVGEYQTRR